MRALGCDIGNGFAFVSVLNEDGDPISALPSEWNGRGMPTVVQKMRDGTLQTGRGISRQFVNRGTFYRAIKRTLANYVRVEESGVDPIKAYECVAQTVLDSSFERLWKRGDNPPHEVLLTYPAAFLSAPRSISLITETVANLRAPDGKPYVVLDAIPEPAAIAFDFFLQNKKNEKESSCVAVYDLGHGTFDVALVSYENKEDTRNWIIHNYGCLGNIGGMDFEDKLVEIIKRKISEQDRTAYFNNADESMLLEEAIQAKHELSIEDEVDVFIMLSNGKTYEFVVSRDEFQERIESLVATTISEFTKVLDEAQKKGLALDYIVLSGGSSRIPLVEQKVGELVRQRYHEPIKIIAHRPIEAVSYGATRYASFLDGSKYMGFTYTTASNCSHLGRMRKLYEPLTISGAYVCDESFTYVLDRSWGIVDEQTGDLIVKIRENSYLPATSKTFWYRPNQSHVNLVVACAKDSDTRAERIVKGGYKEIAHLKCDGLHAGGEYAATLSVDRKRVARITLIDENGHVLRME